MFEEIAIIGQSCLFPGCNNIEQFINTVKDGLVTISSPPEGYWRVGLEDITGEEKNNPAFSFTDKGGYIRDFANIFNVEEYELDKNTLLQLDVLFKWSLHTAREALKNSGYLNNRSVLKRAGIVLGNSTTSNSSLTKLSEEIYLNISPAVHPYNRFTGGLPAGIIKKAFSIGGNAFAIDTACASSLYAVKLACDLLQKEETDLMLAGAVCAIDPFCTHLNFNALHALSSCGLSRPFNVNSDGIIPSEGAAFVVLKRLKDALRDGNNISGVIRSIGLSNDGRTGGFLSPSVMGQISSMESAYRISGVDPGEISYVECHATGTKIGDLTEIQSMLKVFPDKREIPIGSIKANLGHLFAVSGMASLIKILGMFKDEFIPLTPNAHPILPAIRDSHFRVPEMNELWDGRKGRRIAGVSNFGFGGSNAHLILEEWKKRDIKIHPLQTLPVKIAVTGMSVITHSTESLEEFKELIYGKTADKKIDKVDFSMGEIAFPPCDLKRTLGQQLLMLKAADKAIGQVKKLNKEGTGVFIGIQTDPGYILTDLTDKLTCYLQKSVRKNKFVSSADTADVTGKMGHITATRINNQYNFKGCGFAVFYEELSGDCALKIAMNAIEKGEIESAVVGAVDLSIEEVQKFAAEKSLPDKFKLPASSAVALVLKRLEDAEKDKDRIYAIISSCRYMENKNDTREFTEKKYSFGNNSDDFNLTTILGHSHAASGLLHIAAGIIILNHYLIPYRKKTWFSRKEENQIEILNESFMGGYYKTVLKNDIKFSELCKIDKPDEIKKPLLTFPLYKNIDTSLLEDFKKEVLSRRNAKNKTGRILKKAPLLAPITDILFSEKDIIINSSGQIEHKDIKENKVIMNPMLSPVIRHHSNMMEVQKQFYHSQLKAYNAFMDIEKRLGSYLSRIHTYKNKNFLPVSAGSSEINLPEVLQKPSGPSFGREELEILASGKISTVFGKLFEKQDMYELQIRPPAPPFLLCDRVTGIEGEAGSMATGTIWTETDVKDDSWYLCNGRMPGGIFFEASTGTTLLPLWLGFDFLNKGKRVLRFLGSERIFYGPLPCAGETLQYRYTIDRYIEQGERRLFFFHSECLVNGEIRMKVRNGQGGFFTREELKNSRGLLWDAEKANYTENPLLHIPPDFCKKTHFTTEEVKSYFEGNGYECFKEGFEILKTHKRSPVSLVGKYYFIDEITEFNPYGGPKKRGYLCGRTTVDPDWWFFKVHFKNDPCMPGNLMAEGCIQMMSFYLSALGFTKNRDGWRFEPVPGEKCKALFRSQITPEAKEILYEIFIDDITEDLYPTVYAHTVVTVDGRKAFCCERASLRLIPDETRLEEKTYSLSEGQKALWFLNKSDPCDLSYNLPVAFRVTGDIERLKYTVKFILEKHELFLSKFKLENYELYRIIDREVKINIEEEDISDSNLEEALKYLKKHIEKPFDLEKAPPLRSVLCKYSGDNYILLLVFHHIVFDGISLPILINEIMEFYDSPDDGKNIVVSNNYEDFVRWQKEFLTSEEGPQQLAYWKSELSGELPQINLPLKNKITSVKNNTKCHIFNLDRETIRKIKELSLKEGVTFFSVILSAFKILLFKYTKEEDLITVTPVSGRIDKRFEKTAGYFVNLIAIRTNISEKMCVKDFVIHLNKKIFHGLINGNYPFSRLLSELKIKRKSQRHTVFQIMFIFQNWVKHFDKKSDSLKLETIPHIYPFTDCSVNMEIYEDDAKGYFTYDANLFDEEIIKEMSQNYNKILTSIPLYFDKNIEDIDILSEEEKNKIISSIPVSEEAVENFIPSGNEMEAKLTKIWEDLLGINPAGIRDDFFKLGGSSLLAVKLFAEIHKQFGRELPLSILLQGATVEYMADILREKEDPHLWKSLVPVQNKGQKPPFYCVNPVGGDSIFFLPLSGHLAPDRPFYGLQMKIEDFTSVEALASHYIREIETFQAKGPYYLGGFTSGGPIAFEMARQFHRKGCEVGALVIFDTGLTIPWKPEFILRLICYFPYWLCNFLKKNSKVKAGIMKRGIKRARIGLSSLIKPCNRPTVIKDIVDVDQVLRDYLPEPYYGNLMLFRSSIKPLIYAFSYDNEMGWKKIVKGSVEVRVIPEADHMGIFKEPYVGILARELKEYLDRGQQNDKNQ